MQFRSSAKPEFFGDFRGHAPRAAGDQEHPAFGQLVRSRLWRRALERVSLSGEREIAVHPSDLSDAQGHRRDNLVFLQQRYSGLKLSADSAVPRGTVAWGGAGAALLDLAFYFEDLEFGESNR